MFSAIFFIVFAMGLVSVESSTVQSAFAVDMRCTKKGWEADMDALASGPVDDDEILKDACIYLRVSITEYLYITSIHQLVLRSFLSFLKRRRTTKNKNLWWRWKLQPRRGGNWEAVRGSEWICSFEGWRLIFSQFNFDGGQLNVRAFKGYLVKI